MVDVGPVFYAMLAALLLFFFFIYLMIRRTVLGFKEGMDRSRER
jgi:flagellar biogenesis protein FliO